MKTILPYIIASLLVSCSPQENNKPSHPDTSEWEHSTQFVYTGSDSVVYLIEDTTNRTTIKVIERGDSIIWENPEDTTITR